MSKKKLEVTALANDLHGASAFFRQQVQPKENQAEKPIQEDHQNPTQVRAIPSAVSSDTPRRSSRENARRLPTRDEIQEFSFRLRDELKVKVQAEVPHQWQHELEEIARQLDVKKLELYRYVLGEFLGKVKRTSTS